MTFRGDRVKAQREQIGLTQEALAAACEVSQSAVAKWESGNGMPRPPALRSLARVLRVPEAYLMGSTDDPDDEVAQRSGGQLGNHREWAEIRSKLSRVYSAEVLDEVATAQFATGPREFLDLEYARRLADAIVYARSQGLR
jgi:transcriptional regulator with XRE-family HTH domain